MTSITSAGDERVRDAVCEVWRAAELDAATLRGIVPLRHLLQPYNLALSEVPHLTYEVAIREVARETGRILATRPGANRPLAGFLYAEANDGLLLVKKNDPVARRRFSVAHELGHFLLHRSDAALVLTEALFAPENGKAHDGEDKETLPVGQLELAVAGEETVAARPSPGADDLRRMEREANAFAAELLMPQALCESLFAAHRKQFGTSEHVLLHRLSGALLVSPEALHYRLKGLELLATSITGRHAP